MQDSNAGQSTACDVAVGWFAIFLSGCRLLPFMSMNGCGSIPFHSIAQASFRVDPKAYERRTQGNPKLCRFLSVHSYMSSEKHECQPRFRYGLPLSFYRFKGRYVLLLGNLLLLRPRPSPVGSSGRILQKPPHVCLQLVFVKDGRLGFVPERNHVVGRQRGPPPGLVGR
jgi:hypothetical protein